MSYNYHITRRAFWADPNTGPAIGREEWLKIAGADGELRHIGYVQFTYGSEALWLWDPDGRVPNATEETGLDCLEDGAFSLHYDRSGNLRFDQFLPLRRSIAKASAIAAALSGVLVGDENEGYNLDGSAYWRDEKGRPDGPTGDPGLEAVAEGLASLEGQRLKPRSALPWWRWPFHTRR